MTVVAAADAIAPDRLRALAAPFVPSQWTVHAEATPRGALLVAGSAIGRAGDWITAGSPVSHPWGIPAEPAPLDGVASAFHRYGPAAVQIPAGPFLAVDVRDGTVARAVNGIVPLHVSPAGAPWAASTSSGLLAAIAGGPGRAVPPGASAGPGGMTEWVHPLPEHEPPGMRWGWVESVVASELSEAGIAPAAGVPRRPDDVYEAGGGQSVLLPRLGRQFTVDRYRALRQAVPDLWWRQRLAGRWLCAPLFERPALDALLMLGTVPR